MNERGISLQIIQSLEGLYRDVMFNFMTISLNNTLNGLSPQKTPIAKTDSNINKMLYVFSNLLNKLKF